MPSVTPRGGTPSSYALRSTADGFEKSSLTRLQHSGEGNEEHRMSLYKRQWFWAILAALPYAAWEFGHWWAELEVYTPWAFGQGFAAGSLIFGFWGLGSLLLSKAPVVDPGTALPDVPTPQILHSEPPALQVEEEVAIAEDLDLDRVRKAEQRIKYYSSA
jgi:hypothetical protein